MIKRDAFRLLHRPPCANQWHHECCGEQWWMCAGDAHFCIVTVACATTSQLLKKLFLLWLNSGIAQQSSGTLSQAGRLASSLHLFSPDKLQACEVFMYVSRLITHIDSAEPAWPESIHPFSFLMQSLYHREKGGEGDCCSKSPLPRFCVYYAICFRVLIMVLTDLYVCCWLLVCPRVWVRYYMLKQGCYSLTVWAVKKHSPGEQTTFSIRSKPVFNSKSPSWHHWLTWIWICYDVTSDISSCYLQQNCLDSLSDFQLSSKSRSGIGLISRC